MKRTAGLCDYRVVRLSVSSEHNKSSGFALCRHESCHGHDEDVTSMMLKIFDRDQAYNLAVSV